MRTPPPPTTAPPAAEPRARLLATIPGAERRIEPAGLETAVIEAGAGPPLVLLHGPGEHAPKWLRVIPSLAATHRVIAPDLPGHGASPLEGEPPGAERTLAWLRDLIEATCPQPPVLVGQILGGAIAARFAAEHGAAIAGLVLVDALGLVPFAPAPEFGQALEAFVAGPSGETHDALWSRCASDLDRLRAAMGADWEALRDYNLDRAVAPEVQAAMGALMGAFAMEAIAADDLARIAVPTELIWGRHDLATPIAGARRVSERHGWPLAVIDHAGDDPPIEQPEAFVRALRATLARMS